jgi:hypothetical protein
VISLTYYRSDQSLCPLCLEWFLPLARQQDCILEYILPTKPKRAEKLTKKPRTSRKIARKNYLKVTKKRRPSPKERRKTIGQQLGYMQRNLGYKLFYSSKTYHLGDKLLALNSIIL